MNWLSTVKKILGFYWCSVCKDSWIALFISDTFTYLSGKNIVSRVNALDGQIKCCSMELSDCIPATLLLVNASDSSAVIPLSNIILTATTTTTIGQKTTGAVYKRLTNRDIPLTISLKVKLPSIILYKDVDYKLVDNKLQFNKALSLYGFNKTLKTVLGNLLYCFLLWGLYIKYNTCIDKFTLILQLPKYWLYKYPGAVLAAWDIRYNGCNKQNIKVLLNAVGNCPSAETSGRVEVKDKKVYLQLKVYCGTNPIVMPGQYVVKGQLLFSASSDSCDYTHVIENSLPAFIKSIPILSETGVLYAVNQDNVAVIDNTLPLQGDSITAYKLVCSIRNADMHILYHKLPNSINPAQYIFNTVWKHSGVCIIIPSTYTEDMQKALNFILKHINKGSVILVYIYNKNQARLIYPDVDALNQLLLFYYNQQDRFTMKYNTDKITD